MSALTRLRTLLGRRSHGEEKDWHRRIVGGMWERMGKHQFDYLVTQGLEPQHQFLDVGCGSLRGGVHFVRYLETGHYVGLDIDAGLLEAGQTELARALLLDKEPTLVQTDHFDVAPLGRTFDFALAQSVFTHLPLNSIIRCLAMVGRVLAPDGRFYATFFENADGRTNLGDISHPVAGENPIVSHFDRDPFHYSITDIEWASSGSGLRCSYVGEWDHPRGQRMLMFSRTDA